MKAAVLNLGCRVNEYEAEKMAAALKDAGCDLVHFDDKADIYIVNTCTVTSIADRKSRQMLRRAKKLNPDAVVIAAGCYVDIKSETLADELGIDIAVRNADKPDIAEIVREYLKKKKETGAAAQGNELADSDAEEGIKYRERAFIKIQDGCNNFCSYCIIPYARGRIRSLTEEDALKEVIRYRDAGYKEVILSGIHIGSYGLDRGEEPGKALLSLLEKVNDLEGIERIRLGSVEPNLMTEDFIRGLSGIGKVCPQFHLSLQSGSDSVLKRMNRKYDTAAYMRSCALLREQYGDPAITTDIIVGFPGETEEEFLETIRFAEAVQFYKIHIFKYSPRKGTVAAGMEDQVDPAVKNERSQRLSELDRSYHEAYMERHLGQEAEVLLEEKKRHGGKTVWTGYSREYIPYAVSAEEEEDLANRIVRCTGSRISGGMIIAERI